MYVPAHFRITDSDEIAAVVRECGIGTLVVVTNAGLEATPLPVMLHPDEGEMGALHGHVSRANPLWSQALTEHEVLVTFSPADAYVSPRYLPSKAEHQKVVPTWNYIAVHVHGRLVVHDDAAWVAAQTRELTDVHEAGVDVATGAPWSVDDAPADYIAATLRGIVGLAVHITRIEAKAKLSQNRTAADHEGVRRAHLRGDEAARRLAADMLAADMPFAERPFAE